MSEIGLSLSVRPMEFVPPTNPVRGYYVDTATGIRYYFDGVSWFQINGVLLIPLGPVSALGITDIQWTGTKTVIAPGDTVTANISFKYSGPAITNYTLEFQIGNQGLTWNTGVAATPLQLSHVAVTTPTIVNISMSVIIPSPFDTSNNDVLVRISGGTPTAISETGTRYFDRLTVLAPVPTVTDVEITTITKA